MTIPIIDFRSKTCVTEMYDAYASCGFAVFTNVYDEWLTEFSDWKNQIDMFFALPKHAKKMLAYSGVTENIGYNWLEEERLTPTSPGDIKESYNWVSPDRMQDKYWPATGQWNNHIGLPDFKRQAQKIERIARMLSYEFLYKFEEMFELSRGFLVEKHVDGSSTMRIIHYPKWDGEVEVGQLRGGSHTDYGSITLLWRFDDVGGLQVENRFDGHWEDVPVVENSIVLNVADLFSRWSNGILKSTNHRVVNTDMTKSRYSMPYFVDAGRDVMIENFTKQPDKHPPISAYEYLKWRLAQSYDDGSYRENMNIRDEGQQYLPGTWNDIRN
jgi:isopenicillin N synthase-like dioxygenase